MICSLKMETIKGHNAYRNNFKSTFIINTKKPDEIPLDHWIRKLSRVNSIFIIYFFILNPKLVCFFHSQCIHVFKRICLFTEGWEESLLNITIFFQFHY